MCRSVGCRRRRRPEMFYDIPAVCVNWMITSLDPYSAHLHNSSVGKENSICGGEEEFVCIINDTDPPIP